MNEHIRRLAVQAGLDDADFPIENWDIFFLAKFAELIVNKCISIVATVHGQAIDDSWNVDEAMSMAEMDLKDYFGVEE